MILGVSAAPQGRGMDRGASDYLHTVAAVAVTFVGFSTVFVTFREALGGTMSKYDVPLIHHILYLGVTAIVGCLLPPQLGLLGRPAATLWPAASAPSSPPSPPGWARRCSAVSRRPCGT